MNEAPADEGGKAPLPEINGYRLLRVLGTGGMSTVYLGDQVSLARQVAIKVMLPEALADEVSRRRFENEARTIARLEHPHIVGIFEVGRTRDGLPYYSMPYLPRGHLGQRIVDDEGRPMDQAHVREILHALLSALGYAHARGTIHRDVKAENVLFDEAGRPLLADFGIALRRGFGTRITTAGLAVGSTAYMAPEQARGEEVDHRADLYAIGVLAWEMLTGELPFNADDAVAMAIRHAKDPIPRLPPHLRHWQRFMDRALAKGPLKRFHDAAHMAEALDRVSQRGNTREMAALPALQETATRVRRIPVVAWLGVVLVAAAGTGLLLRDKRDDDAFYRVPPAAPAATPATTAGNGTPAERLPTPYASPDRPVVGDPASALLRAAPTSDAERWVEQADRQIDDHRLTTPKSGNAYDSLLAARQSDPGYLGLAPAVARFMDAIAAEIARDIAAGEDAPARERYAQAMRLAERTGQSGSAGVARLRRDVMQAFTARIGKSAAVFDRESALATANAAKAFGLAPSELQELQARADAIPQPGEPLDGTAGDLVLVRNGDTLFAASRRPVSRNEYAQFAAATGREAALCRASASLLRIIDPRSWESPGFDQSGSQPVVCVSWNDAEAYARWKSDRDGRRYRLPHAREAGLLPAGDGARRIAEWNSDCSGDCSRRIGSGATWRGNSGARPLDASRGYDDVGIRLVSDLPHAVATH